jgi:pilus assembly protein CpaE
MTLPRVIAVGAPQTFRQQLARSLGVEPDLIDWLPSVTAAEGYLGDSAGSPTANVLVLSPEIKEPDAFGLAEFVNRSAPTSAVLLVRERAMNGLLPLAMRAGVRDVIDLSKGAQELREGVTRAIRWCENLGSISSDVRVHGPTRKGMVISIFSSKGGTGKTFLACNLAASIAIATKTKTAVLDLDFDLGDVFAYFGRDPSRPFQDLISLGDEADEETVLAMGTQLHENLWGYGSPHDPTAVQPGGESMGKFVRTLRGTFDYTVIDATADYSDATLAAFDLSDHICLISGLDVVGVRHLSMAYQTLQSLGVPRERLRVVMNRADSKVGIDTRDVERVTGLILDAAIPSSRAVPISLNKARPVAIHEPKSEVAKAVQTFAEKLVATTKAPVASRASRSRVRKR